MPDDYAGNPVVYPATIPVHNDGDTKDAATWGGTALEGLADRTAWIQGRLSAQYILQWATIINPTVGVPDNIGSETWENFPSSNIPLGTISPRLLEVTVQGTAIYTGDTWAEVKLKLAGDLNQESPPFRISDDGSGTTTAPFAFSFLVLTTTADDIDVDLQGRVEDDSTGDTIELTGAFHMNVKQFVAVDTP